MTDKDNMVRNGEEAQPMRGLADWLEHQAAKLDDAPWRGDPIVRKEVETLRRWAQEARSTRSSADEGGNERTPQDYALEHAEYMAHDGERFIDAVNDLALAQEECENGTANPSDVDAAQELVGERMKGLRSGIYEFRKRRDRASISTKKA